MSSEREKRWIKNHLISNKKAHIESLLFQLGFSERQYNFGIFNGDDALYVSYGIYSYIIMVDWSNVCLILLELNRERRNKQSKNHKYHQLNVRFNSDSAWFQMLKYIKNRN